MAEVSEISDERLEALMISREDYTKMKAEVAEREKRVPQVGDQAPEFDLERLDFDGKRTGERVSLASLRGKPVTLYFGSYT
jgi:hypothetical protein